MTFCSVAVADDAKTSALNSLGQKVSFERVEAAASGRSTEVSEVDDLTGAKVILVNGEARVSESDLMATNGVIHVVDTLLPTESAMPVSTLFDKRNLTMFKQLIELNGFGEELDSYVNVSIFAPTDEALENSYWAKKIESEPDSLKGNTELTSFLKYHIAKPLTKTCDLSEKQLDTETGEKVRINLYSTNTIFSNVLNRATVNCARLVHFDDDSCGSVLHQVDRVLEPPTQVSSQCHDQIDIGLLESNFQRELITRMFCLESPAIDREQRRIQQIRRAHQGSQFDRFDGQCQSLDDHFDSKERHFRRSQGIL